jgi:leucyl-tRNA synthetase
MKSKTARPLCIIVITCSYSTDYKAALKFGFYDMLTTRDWYREVTADIGMHAELVRYWIRVSALLVTPIAPHFTEHIWSTVLQESKSIQLALWPEPPHPVDKAIVDAGAYMRNTVKTIRDAELNIMKRINKGKKGKGGNDAPFDPKKPKSVRIYVATAFPEWQDACVRAAKNAYIKEANKIDDVKVREVLTAMGLIKDKRAMPFIQLFKVNDRIS